MKQLQLKPHQEAAYKDLIAAWRKCRDAGIALINAGDSIHVVDDEDIYDVDANYNDYSIVEVNVKELRETPIRCYNVEGDAEKCRIALYSTKFPEGGKGIIY